jgi:hypothetical protein
MVGCFLEERKDVLGDIGVRQRGVRVPITWQSVALGVATSFRPAIPESYEKVACATLAGACTVSVRNTPLAG